MPPKTVTIKLGGKKETIVPFDHVKGCIEIEAGDKGLTKERGTWWCGFLHGIYLYERISGKQKIELVNLVERLVR